MHMRPIFFGVAVLVTIAACDPITSELRGITVQLDANPKVVQTGDTVTFVVNVSATEVSGVVIDFGDFSGDQFATGGASTASVTFQHAYVTNGTFQARATVSDAVVGDRVVSQSIVVNVRVDTTQNVRK